MTQWIHLNGELLPEEDARISVWDGGLLHGAGLFETMRAENGRVFRLEAHVARLMRSADVLLRPIGRDALPSEADFHDLLDRNSLAVGRIRLTVTAGAMRAENGDAEPKLTVLASASALSGYSQAHYLNGVSVVVSRFKQSADDPTLGHKTICYLPRLLALRQARQTGGMEAIWFTADNRLAEGSISNVFVVKQGAIKTPPVDTPVLPGIARSVVLESAAEAGMNAQEVALTINDLLDADEVFITNAAMQVMPVVRVEKKDIGDGKVGPVAQQMLGAYRDLVRKECGQE